MPKIKRFYVAAFFALLFGAPLAYAAPSVVYQPTILPTTTDTYDLGSSAKEWNNIYVKDFHCTGSGCSGGGGGSTLITAGNGISTSSSSGGAILVSNTGVLSNIAGTGISVSGATGNVTVSNTGVISLGNGTGTTCSGTNPGTCNVNTTQNITKLSGLTTNGFVQTSGGDGTLSSAALTSGNVTTALGFTPYNATNPSGYIANVTGLVTAGTNVTLTGAGTSGSPYVINSSGSGGGTGTVGTSSSETANQFPFWTTTSATPALLSGTSNLFRSGSNIGVGTSTPGSIFSIGTSPNQVANFGAATSTIYSNLTVANGSAHLGVYGDGATAPVFGELNNIDLIDAVGNAADLRTINIVNNHTGACATPAFMADGDNPALNNNFAFFGFLNTGFTGGAGCASALPQGLNNLSTLIYTPTWDMDSIIGTTTTSVAGVPVGWKYGISAAGGATTQLAVLTAAGNYGVGTTTPWAQLSVNGQYQPTISASTPALFAIGSTTLSAGTTTAFLVDNRSFVGVGTTTPGALLAVQGSGNFPAFASRGSGTGDIAQFYTSAGTKSVSIDQNGVERLTSLVVNGTISVTSNAVTNTPLTLQTVFGAGVTADILSLGHSGGGTTGLVNTSSVINNFAQFAIGTTSTPWMLNVATSSVGTKFNNGQFAISDANAATNKKHWLFSSEGGSLFIGTSSDAYATSTNAAVSLTNDGKVGIGTTSPAYAVTVGTAGNNYGSILSTENKLATTTSMTIDWSQGNQQLVQIGTSATTIGFSKVIQGGTLRVPVCNPASGTAGAITWTGVEWSGNTIPTQTTTANTCDVWSFIATQATSTAATSFKIFGAMSSNYP